MPQFGHVPLVGVTVTFEKTDRISNIGDPRSPSEVLGHRSSVTLGNSLQHKGFPQNSNWTRRFDNEFRIGVVGSNFIGGKYPFDNTRILS